METVETRKFFNISKLKICMYYIVYPYCIYSVLIYVTFEHWVFCVRPRDRQWIVFSLPISTREILNIIETTILKFNDSEYSLQLRFIRMSVMSMSRAFASNSYHSKYIWFISLLIQIHNFTWLESFIKIYSISCCCCIYNKIKRTHKQKRHKLLVSSLMYESKSYLLCVSCKCWVMESRHHTYCSVWIRWVFQTLIWVVWV